MVATNFYNKLKKDFHLFWTSSPASNGHGFRQNPGMKKNSPKVIEAIKINFQYELFDFQKGIERVENFGSLYKFRMNCLSCKTPNFLPFGFYKSKGASKDEWNFFSARKRTIEKFKSKENGKSNTKLHYIVKEVHKQHNFPGNYTTNKQDIDQNSPVANWETRRNFMKHKEEIYK